METCRLCGNREGNEHHQVREMLHGTREVFPYLRCGQCHALQIETIPEDLSRFYPADYYSYQVRSRSRLRHWLKRQAARHLVQGDSLVGGLLCRWFQPPELLLRVLRSGIGFDARILEIGSGAGKNILDLYHMGFRRVTGVDPYLPEAILHDNGVQIHKCQAGEIQGEFDLILLNDVFEHLPDPDQMLQDCEDLLTQGGVLLIRTPVADCQAWQDYGVDWVQIDAPRHLNVVSPKSLEILAERAGLEIRDVLWDSTDFQFWGSEQYRRDIPMREDRSYAENPATSIFGPREIREFRRRTAELNESGLGDAACFYLHKRVTKPVTGEEAVHTEPSSMRATVSSR